MEHCSLYGDVMLHLKTTDNLEQLEVQIKSIQLALRRLIEEEDYPVYKDLLKSYNNVEQILKTSHSLSDIQKEIKWNCRKLSEAPPRNKEQGKLLMIKLDAFHQYVHKENK